MEPKTLQKTAEQCTPGDEVSMDGGRTWYRVAGVYPGADWGARCVTLSLKPLPSTGRAIALSCGRSHAVLIRVPEPVQINNDQTETRVINPAVDLHR